jgi:hypothetical protein
VVRPSEVSFLPDLCAECGAEWDDGKFGFSPRQRVVDLVCQQGHPARFNLSVVELLEFEAAVVPWMAAKPFRFVGGSVDGEIVPFPEPVPEITTEAGERYVYRREDSDAYVYEFAPGAGAPDNKRNRPWSAPWRKGS